MARKRRYQGVVNLPVDLPVASEALGLRERVRVGGSLVELGFPQRPQVDYASGEVRALQAPGDPCTGGALAPVLQRAYEDHWGYVSSPTVSYVRSVGLSVVLPPSPLMAATDDLRLLGEHLGEWWETVRLWASVWMGVPLTTGGGHFSSTVHLADGSGLSGSGSVVGGGHGRADGPLVCHRQGLDIAQMRRAFRQASREQRPPIPHALLLAAVEAGWAGDHRRAVIDSVTAVEVALAIAVFDCLRRHRIPPAFADAVILQANGVVGLLNLFKSLGGISPVSRNKARDQLARPRNDAAHKGLTPSAEVVEQVHSHARSLVQAVTPLAASSPQPGL